MDFAPLTEALSKRIHMKSVTQFVLLFLALVLSACSAGPGPLEGKWKMDGDLPMTIEFRDGESESMGMIEKVDYEVRGSDVLVRYKNGLAKGTAMRFTVVDEDTLRSELGTLHRVN
jgi:hypothetical protein